MFKAMHSFEEPLVLCNVWDVPSAQIAEKVGYRAIGTSSAAIAKALGREDGQNIEFAELLSIVAAISQSTDLPLTVDIESGYGNTAESVADNIAALASVGVVGINIEDSEVTQGVRHLVDSVVFSTLLKEVRDELNSRSIDMFINVRCDTFLLGLDDPVKASLERIKHYDQAGADGIFLPCIKDVEDIKATVASTHLPINVMCLPDLPGFDELKELGVRRISMGNFAYEAMLNFLSGQLATIRKEQSFQSLFL